MAMWAKVALLVAVTSTVISAEKIFLSSYWTSDDTKRITDTFQTILGIKDDLSAVHYATSGLRLLNQKPTDTSAKRACELAQKADLKDMDQLFHASSIAGDLPSCKISAGDVKSAVDAVAKESEVNTERLFDALTIADRLGAKADNVAFDKSIMAAITKDSSPKSLANAIAAASLLDKATGAKYFEYVKILIDQADEVDGKYLQLDGGLSVTATAVYAVAQLAEKQGKAPTISKDQILQLTNYLLSRRQVFADRPAYNVIRAMGVLINNKFAVPASIALESGNDVSKPLRLHVSNVYGLPLPGTITVKANVLKGSTVVEQGKIATKVASDASNTLYELSLNGLKESGHYTLQLTVSGASSHIVGTSDISFPIKVTNEAVVEGLKVSILEKDGATVGNEQSIALFAKAAKELVVDLNGRVVVSFSVKSKTGASLQPHQAFVIFEHVETSSEIVFVADHVKNEQYKLEVNLAKEGADFDGHSGKYKLRLVIGDSLLRSPINWVFADATLTLPPSTPSIVRKSQRISYDVLPEISHLFRQPEKRPPVIVSNAFTLLCLVPLVILIILWFAIGVNLSGMPLSIYVPIFHISLTALFALYIVFWLQLDMFVTLKYIAVFGGVTFIAGHRLLRLMASQRKEKTA